MELNAVGPRCLFFFCAFLSKMNTRSPRLHSTLTNSSVRGWLDNVQDLEHRSQTLFFKHERSTNSSICGLEISGSANAWGPPGSVLSLLELLG